MKKLLKYTFLTAALVLLMGCNKTNWDENYREKEKSPFGTYILFNEIDSLFNQQDVVLLKDNLYDYLYNEFDSLNTSFDTYICIKNDAKKLPEEGVTALLEFVEAGNHAFLALNYFDEVLEEKLQITTNNLDRKLFAPADLKELKGEFYLDNEKYANDVFTFDRNIQRHYFITYNENKTIVLGSSKIDGEKVPNFLKIYHGKGAIYVHTNPVVFTNYYLLKDNNTYVENVLSYLPTNTLLWDPQTKYSKLIKQNKEKENTVFDFFLQHKTLTWFLFVGFAGLLLFMFFNAKRKQRAIPVLHPLKNTTVAFTQTISSLYLKENNHKNLVDKKITYFLAKVRTKYLLDTNNLNKQFIANLAAKSGNEISKTKYLVNTIIALHKKSECTEEELLVFYKMIENFFKK